MEYGGNFKKTEEFAEAAFSFMRENRIGLTPRNFTIWYTYFAATYPDLNVVLDRMRENGEDFTEAFGAELYARFFEVDIEAEAIRQTGALIEASIAKVLDRLGDAGRHATDYGERLESYSGQLRDGAAASDLRPIVDGILAETQKMRRRSEEVSGELRRSSDEIVELRRDLENVRREAHTDGLTGIANRRSFDERLREAVLDTCESGQPLSLLMIDIDHFKKFNDRFGHQVGDKVLQLVARILKKSVKGRDIVARYGGEEFVIVLPQTALAGAVTVADQTRQAVASRKIVQKGTGVDYGTITLSVGVSGYCPGESVETLIRRADQALYVAKNSGRNRVMTEEAKAPALVAS